MKRGNKKQFSLFVFWVCSASLAGVRHRNEIPTLLIVVAARARNPLFAASSYSCESYLFLFLSSVISMVFRTEGVGLGADQPLHDEALSVLMVISVRARDLGLLWLPV